MSGIKGTMGIENHRTWWYLFWVYHLFFLTNDDTDGSLKYTVYVQLDLSMILGGSLPTDQWINPTYPTEKTSDIALLGIRGSSPPSNHNINHH